ncbi:hypothetical protein CJ030_MR7G022012 [Morella rubra]|uniref:Uncharacterized protein n=1 Tax=Morella rubra TaxID=262757 RepID=A0A6A1V1H8_9ROSI|nr:hypothetical protein CJ030_MR7G022012 [Morella rubra]
MTKKALRNLKRKKGSVPYAHLNPDGGVLPQSTRTSRAMGIMILIFRSLALIVVQRHTAASKSASPCSTGQHVSLALLPIPTCTRPLSKSTHAPNFRVSMGHVPCVGGVGDGTGGCGTIGVGGGLGTTGVGVGGGLGTGGGYRRFRNNGRCHNGWFGHRRWWVYNWRFGNMRRMDRGFWNIGWLYNRRLWWLNNWWMRLGSKGRLNMRWMGWRIGGLSGRSGGLTGG